ncbi:MAG: cobyric acid synthase [Pseudomonadota bacterium]
MTAAVMLQGTGSDVGKSLLAAGLCRLFTQRGLKVAPFKPQNMSNNAGVTVDGGEIGRAQMLQARAARRAATVDMNPVLLKPQSETGAQVIVRGKLHTTADARAYSALKASLLPEALQSFARLSAEADIVIVEGAGSPAEVNLRAGDIANMGFARAANVPVVLVGDIDRGGVIASVVGTHTVMPEADRAPIRGVIINRFRGDVSLFDGGRRAIETFTGWPCLGVVPYFAKAAQLPAEDTLGLRGGPGGPITIVMPKTPHIANFDDADPLRLEPGCTLRIVPLDAPLPMDADAVLLPGSKSTRADLAALIAAGWDIDLRAFVRRGGTVLGLCGGYQILGRAVHDPNGLEGAPGHSAGLGLLDIETTLAAPKTTVTVDGVSALAQGVPLSGYRIHMGRTAGPDCARPFAQLATGPDGAVSPSGRVMGAYVHGVFASDPLRAWFLARLGAAATLDYDATIETVLDDLATHLAKNLDIDALLQIASARAA